MNTDDPTTTGLAIVRKAAELAGKMVANLTETETDTAAMFGLNFRESPTLKAVREAHAYLAQAAASGAPCFDVVRSVIPAAELKAVAQ